MVSPVHNNFSQYGDNSSITPEEFKNAVGNAQINLENNNPQAAQAALNTIYQFVSPGGAGNTTSGGHTLYLFLSNFLVNTAGQPTLIAPSFQPSNLKEISNSPGLLKLFSTLTYNALNSTTPPSSQTDFINVASILAQTSNGLSQSDFENLAGFISQSFEPFLSENSAVSAAFGAILNTSVSGSSIMSMISTISESSNSLSSNDLYNFSTSISDFFATFTLPNSPELRVTSSALFSTLLGFLTDPNPIDHGFDSSVPLAKFLNQPASANNALAVIALLYLGEPEQMMQANGSTLQSGFADALWNNLTKEMQAPPSFSFGDLMSDWFNSNGPISSTDSYLQSIELLMSFFSERD